MRSLPFRKHSDEELIDGLCAGTADALSTLFDRYYRLVFSIALKILHDRGEAEDMMQEVFFEIYRTPEKFDPARGSVKTWILQYAYHRSLNRRRYLKVRGFYETRQDSLLGVWGRDLSSNQPSGLTQKEWEAVFTSGFKTLKEKERKTLELAYFKGLLLKEVADQMGEPLVNVRNYYYRGLKKLRSFVNERHLLHTSASKPEVTSDAN
jgi:RNA polymerase sigma-70 factor (ECF subfamily)